VTVITKLSDRPWTNWFQEVGINYDQQPTPTPTPTPEVKTVTIEMPVLRKGDKIQACKTLQACLDVYGYGLAIDGSFGGKTETALKDFQKKHGLTVDGVCGKNSWNALLK
jgi:peptidoglycan hydrolase-like protein with peptidoglycan-binding domain